MKERYINAYAVTRHYGGPEEGGWWYNWYTPIDSIAIPKIYQGRSKRAANKVKTLRESLQKKHDHINEGNIYHSTGGVSLDVFVESVQYKSKSTQRPHYE